MSVESFAIATSTAARRRIGVTLAMSVLVVLLALISLGIGAVRLSPFAVTQALFGGGGDVAQVIVREIRLPRMILGLAIGAILGLSGAALQGLLRNPLASPSLFGAPQSAAFGAVAVIALGLADVRSYALPIAAIVAAFGSVVALLTIAGRNAGLLILILAGLAIAAGCDGILICSGDHARQSAALEALIYAVESGELPFARVNDALKRHQRAKERFLTAAVASRPLQRSALRQRLGRSGRRGGKSVLMVHVSESELDAKSELLDELRPRLVQTIAKLKGMQNDEVDKTVARVDRWLERNRKKAAAASK